jgi:hypothetical protein
MKRILKKFMGILMNCIKLQSILMNIPYRQETMGGTMRQQERQKEWQGR